MPIEDAKASASFNARSHLNQAVFRITGTQADRAANAALLDVATHVAAGTSTAVESAALRPGATAAGVTIATYAMSIVSAFRSCNSQLVLAQNTYDAALAHIYAATTEAEVEAAVAAATLSLSSFGNNALLSDSAWKAFRATANDGSSALALSAGINGSARFVRGTLNGMRGCMIKLSDIGIAPVNGARISIDMIVEDTARSPAAPTIAGEALLFGLLKSSLTTHSIATDMQVVTNLISHYQPVDAAPFALPFRYDVTLTGGRDALFIAGDTTAMNVSYSVDISSLKVARI